MIKYYGNNNCKINRYDVTSCSLVYFIPLFLFLLMVEISVYKYDIYYNH